MIRQFIRISLPATLIVTLAACQPNGEDAVENAMKEVNVIDESNLNDVMLTIADPNEAVTYFERAVRSDPSRIDLLRGLGKSLIRAARASEALPIWKAVVEHPEATAAAAARTAAVARLGEGGWKGLFSLVSLAGFALICIGYGEARLNPVVLWTAPGWLYWVTLALMLPAMILLVAGNLPGSRIKQRVGHPMLLSVKVWAAAHLLVNGDVASMILFGGLVALVIPAAIQQVVAARVSSRGTPSGPRPPR